jgi:hypothetical protein
MVSTCLQTHSLSVPDLGVTLRTLLAVAAQGYDDTGRRAWTVRFKGAKIGTIQVKTDPPDSKLTKPVENLV